MRALVFVCIGLFFGFSAGPARPEEGLSVLASIKPVQGLVAGVMDGVGEPRLLLPGGASPHTYALKPSDARSLAQATVVFWIGPTLEVFLQGALHALASEARLVALGQAAGVTQREGHEAEAHAEDREPHGERHRHGRYNPHVWLDPLNAAAMVRAIAVELSQVDPANAQHYAANADRLEDRLLTLDSELDRVLRPLAGRPYVVFHDAYGHLEARYGLAPAGIVTVSPELPPGAARVAEIRRLLRARPGICVFAEPQFEPKLIRSLTAGTGAETAVLDPLGSSLAEGPGHYFELMRHNARVLRGCLEVRG